MTHQPSHMDVKSHQHLHPNAHPPGAQGGLPFPAVHAPVPLPLAPLEGAEEGRGVDGEERESEGWRRYEEEDKDDLEAMKYSKRFMLSLYRNDYPMPLDLKENESVASETPLIPVMMVPPAEEDLTSSAGRPLSNSRGRGGRGRRGGRGPATTKTQKWDDPSELNSRGRGKPDERYWKKTNDFFHDSQEDEEYEFPTTKFTKNSSNDREIGETLPEWAVGETEAFTKDFEFNYAENDQFFAQNHQKNSENHNNNPLNAPKQQSEVADNPVLAQFFKSFQVAESVESEWMYKDPSGQAQGPFSAAQMDKWLKNNFFKLDLLVKRKEEEHYAPLMLFFLREQRNPFNHVPLNQWLNPPLNDFKTSLIQYIQNQQRLEQAMMFRRQQEQELKSLLSQVKDTSKSEGPIFGPVLQGANPNPAPATSNQQQNSQVPPIQALNELQKLMPGMKNHNWNIWSQQQNQPPNQTQNQNQNQNVLFQLQNLMQKQGHPDPSVPLAPTAPFPSSLPFMSAFSPAGQSGGNGIQPTNNGPTPGSFLSVSGPVGPTQGPMPTSGPSFGFPSVGLSYSQNITKEDKFTRVSGVYVMDGSSGVPTQTTATLSSNETETSRFVNYFSSMNAPEQQDIPLNQFHQLNVTDIEKEEISKHQKQDQARKNTWNVVPTENLSLYEIQKEEERKKAQEKGEPRSFWDPFQDSSHQRNKKPDFKSKPNKQMQNSNNNKYQEYTPKAENNPKSPRNNPPKPQQVQTEHYRPKNQPQKPQTHQYKQKKPSQPSGTMSNPEGHLPVLSVPLN